MYRECVHRLAAVGLGAAIGLLLAGCQDAVFQDGRYQWLKPIADDLDPVARGLDEYGTISMSTPLLTEPDASFAFNLNRTGQQYYTDARSDINGEAAGSTQQSAVSSSGTQVQVDMQKLVQEAVAAATGGATSLLSAAAGPTTLPAINVNVLPTTQSATSALSSDRFTAAMGLLKGPAPVMENRAAIITAAGDSATQAMLNFLVGPNLAGKFKDKRVLLGVSMVAVRPGSTTANGYDASVAQTFIYTYRKARSATEYRIRHDPALRQRIEDEAVPSSYVFGPQTDAKSPLVAAVSPMAETQTLDLQNSLRKQRQQATKIAAALAGFGLGVQAQALNDWVNRTENDTATISGMNVVSAFAHGANICGFSVAPRLRALTDPANQIAANTSAMVLDPVSFPALVLIGIDMDDLRIVAVKREARASTARPASTAEAPAGNAVQVAQAAPGAPADQTTQEKNGEEFDFYEPVLTIYQSTHWTPLRNPSSSAGPGEPLSETNRLAWAAHIERATCALERHGTIAVAKGAGGQPATEPVVDYLKQEIFTLGSQAVHSSEWQYLPEALLFDASGERKPFAEPQIDSMVAGDIQTTADGKPKTEPIWLTGTNLDSIDLASGAAVLPVGGDPASLPSVKASTATLIGKGAKPDAQQAIRFDATASGGKGHVPVAFQFTYKDDRGRSFNLLTPPIDVHSPDATPSKSMTLIRSHDVKGSEQVETVTFPTDAPAATVQSFVTGRVPTTCPSSQNREVDVNVRAHEAGR